MLARRRLEERVRAPRAARRSDAARGARLGPRAVSVDPREYSDTVTAVYVPDGFSADAMRATILERFDMSLGTGLARLKDKVFRIGHLGSINELMLAGTLCGVQMGLDLAGIPHGDGVSPALAYLANPAAAAARSLAAV